MALALFDLDETLLAGDSDYLWGQHLVQQGAVDGEVYERTNRQFYEQYKQGSLDINEFSRFAFKPLSEFPLETLKLWRTKFVEDKIKPIMTTKGMSAIEKHRAAGDHLIIITSTNNFITQPIAELYNVDQLIATQPQIVNGKYTGELDTPCFAHHKIDRLNEWLETSGLNLQGSYGYSDSHNDIPLLEAVHHPYAVDPDDNLRDHAKKHNWEIISFRD
ncbi:MAG: HAD family hydrolase [Gammaproteobacteria bacterium]